MTLAFEKWQALGNDYMIVEQESLPFALTPARVRMMCAPHFGCASDGVLLLARPDDERHVARLRIFNPDGSEAELSGNGAREAALYLHRRGWTDAGSFSIVTDAGEITPTITSERTCRMEIGRATLRSADFPSGGADGKGTVVADGREFAFQHVHVGNPQCVIDVGEELGSIDLARFGPGIESNELFPNRTNVSFVRTAGPGQLRARIFERGVGETLSSGTGASGAAVASVVGGRASTPVTVTLDGGQLEVEVSDQLDVTLSGWAEHVFSGSLSEDLVRALEQADD
ncbi:MAG: diaminopimelate epimerase [Solirubrobacterales bacterium]